VISLKTTIKLKEVGMKWEPTFGDIFYWQQENGIWEKCVLNNQDILETTFAVNECTQSWFFIPRLNQLLAQIETEDMDG